MKSEQQQVGTHVYRENTSTPSTESYRLADEIVQIEIQDNDDNVTLKQSYINLMGQLEIDGIPKEKTSSIGSKIIEQKKVKRLSGKAITESEVYVGTWWFVTAREQGYIDPATRIQRIRQRKSQRQTLSWKTAKQFL